MVLKPLEFSESLSDSPWFRQNLHEHELVLDEAYKNIKNIETQCRELISCTRKLSQAQRAFAKSLTDFKIETVGTNQTDDERVIATCLKEYGKLINQVEEERSKIINEAEGHYLEPLRRFRTEAIGKTIHEEKRKYEKEASKFNASLEKHLHLSTVRKNDFREADAQLDMQRHNFCKASLQYVAEIQSVQERMKFEFVETLSSFLYSWLTFYHIGHVIHEDFKPFLDSVQVRVQKTKESFRCTQAETEGLKEKMLKTHTKAAGAGQSAGPSEHALRPANTSIKQGYVYMQEKSKLPKTIGRDVLKGTWTKYYCVYSKETRIFTMIPVNNNSKSDMKGALGQSIAFKLKECTRRASDSIDKRFCFDVVGEERSEVMTFQAMSEEDRRQWLDAMDGRQPIYSPGTGPSCSSVQTQLDETGFDFVQHCLTSIEERGIREQGLYRNCGVTSKVQKLMQLGLDKRKASGDKLNWGDDAEWEVKTVSSAVKTFLRNLPEPLMTFDLHNLFINAAKMDDRRLRVNHIHYYVYQLPVEHRKMLEIVVRHLKRVADLCEENLMTVGNLGVCFGPTLLRPKEETMAAIMDIKFCNVVVEVLIANCNQIFDTSPPKSVGTPCPPKPDHQQTPKPSAAPPPPPVEAARTLSSDNGTWTPPGNSLPPSYSTPTGAGFRKSPKTSTTHIYDTPTSDGILRHQLGTSFPMASSAASTSGVTTPTTPPGRGPQDSTRSGMMTSSGVGRATGDSSDSLNSLHSLGSESPKQGSGNIPKAKISASYAPSYNPLACETLAYKLKKRHSGTDIMNYNVHHVSSSSSSSSPHHPRMGVASLDLHSTTSISTVDQPRLYSFVNPVVSLQPSRRVKTLYACTPDHESELSFEPGQIITNVYESKEDGWLVGTLNGKTGLIPANYVEALP